MIPSILQGVAAAGVFVSLLVVGVALLRVRHPVGWPRRLPLAVTVFLAAGSAPWSALLLLSAAAERFRPDLLGALGWAIVAVGLILVFTRRVRLPALPPRRSDASLLLVVALLGASYGIFASEDILGGRDMGTYVNHAIHIARQGKLDIAYPWSPHEDEYLDPLMVTWPGFYRTKPTMTAQFGHLYSVWLAQSYAAFGPMGIYCANAALAMLALVVFYHVLCEMVPRHFALVATFFLGSTPSQVWLARTSLTEVFAQFLLWLAILCLMQAMRLRAVAPAGWAGLFLAMAAFARIDSFLVVPCILAVQTIDTAGGYDAATRGVWRAFWFVSVPAMCGAIGYYVLFSTPYFVALRFEILGIGVMTLVAAFILSAVRYAPPSWPARLGAIVRTRWFRIGCAAFLTVVCSYLYFVRPHVTPFARLNQPGHSLDGTRDHREDSFVNLGRYVSPLVLAGGALGVGMVLDRTFRGRSRRYRVPLFVLLGVASVYLWRPSIFPDHFWAIRRFVPIVLPGIILFAAFAFHRLLHGRSVRKLGELLVALSLACYTVWANYPFVTFAEHLGVDRQIRELASQIPEDELLIVNRSNSAMVWAVPLAIAYDRKLVPIRLDDPAARQKLLGWTRNLRHGRPIGVLTEVSLDAPEFDVREAWSMTLVDVFIRKTLVPLPREVGRSSREIRLLHLVPRALKE